MGLKEIIEWWRWHKEQAERDEEELWRPPHPQYAGDPQPEPPPPKKKPRANTEAPSWPFATERDDGKPLRLANNAEYLKDGYCEEQSND